MSQQIFPKPLVTGQDFTFYVRETDDVTDALLNLTGWAAALVIRRIVLDPTPLLSYVETDDAIEFGTFPITDNTVAPVVTVDHNLKVAIPAADTDTLRRQGLKRVYMGLQVTPPTAGESPIQILINEEVELCESIAP